MMIHIRIDSMKAAEELSNICRQFPQELFLRADAYCIDPKSTLGILAIMYSARDKIYLDTGDMEAEGLSRFSEAIAAFRAEQ